MPELQTVMIGTTAYQTRDPVIFRNLVFSGKTPLAAANLVDEILNAIDKMMDGMCIGLTIWPPHKIEYIHDCPDGSKMRLLLEKF